MKSNDKATRGHYEQIDNDRPSGILASPIIVAGVLVEELDQSLLLTAETSVPTATAKPLLSVVAPAALPEGYVMDVQVGGRGQLYTVKVPPGGVEEGQTFEVTISEQTAVGGTTMEEDGGAVVLHRVEVPVGSWRDGLCDCCRVGCFHPTFLYAWCFPTILTAQVMTRMNLNMLGRPISSSTIRQRGNTTFRIVLAIALVHLFLYHVVQPIVLRMTFRTVTVVPEVDIPVPNPGVVNFFYYLQLAYWIFGVYLLTVTRYFVRDKYAIPTNCCRDGAIVEDCCFSFWCTCCTAGQLARHTMDYNTYPGVFCSSTGVPDYVPSIV